MATQEDVIEQVDKLINEWVFSPWRCNRILIALVIARYGEANKRQIVSRTGLSERHIDSRLNEFCDQGFVKRTRKRSFLYSLTQKGWDHLISLQPTLESMRARQ